MLGISPLNTLYLYFKGARPFFTWIGTVFTFDISISKEYDKLIIINYKTKYNIQIKKYIQHKLNNNIRK